MSSVEITSVETKTKGLLPTPVMKYNNFSVNPSDEEIKNRGLARTLHVLGLYKKNVVLFGSRLVGLLADVKIPKSSDVDLVVNEEVFDALKGYLELIKGTTKAKKLSEYKGYKYTGNLKTSVWEFKNVPGMGKVQLIKCPGKTNIQFAMDCDLDISCVYATVDENEQLQVTSQLTLQEYKEKKFTVIPKKPKKKTLTRVDKYISYGFSLDHSKGQFCLYPVVKFTTDKMKYHADLIKCWISRKKLEKEVQKAKELCESGNDLDILNDPKLKPFKDSITSPAIRDIHHKSKAYAVGLLADLNDRLEKNEPIHNKVLKELSPFMTPNDITVRHTRQTDKTIQSIQSQLQRSVYLYWGNGYLNRNQIPVAMLLDINRLCNEQKNGKKISDDIRSRMQKLFNDADFVMKWIFDGDQLSDWINHTFNDSDLVSDSDDSDW